MILPERRTMSQGICRAVLAACLSFLATVEARADDPLKIVQNHVAAEFGPSAEPKDFELLQDLPDSQVVAFSKIVPGGVDDHVGLIPPMRMDAYTFLARGEGGRWSLQGTHSFFGFVFHAARMSSTPLEKLAGELKVDKAQARRVVERALLAASTDRHLIEHFEKKRSIFDQIEQYARQRGEKLSHFDHRDAEFSPLLFAADIESGDRGVLGDKQSAGCKSSECITLTIAAPVFARVGYFHIGQQDKPPKMTEGNYLAIRPLGNGWFLFRQRT